MTALPDSIDPANVRCPTCRANQPWSDVCRRCKSDLRLLREFAGAFENARRACLAGLRDGRPREAELAARRCLKISPGAEARRLLALAALQAGDWARAAELARRLDEN
jgi:hypothetical protein